MAIEHRLSHVFQVLTDVFQIVSVDRQLVVERLLVHQSGQLVDCDPWLPGMKMSLVEMEFDLHARSKVPAFADDHRPEGLAVGKDFAIPRSRHSRLPVLIQCHVHRIVRGSVSVDMVRKDDSQILKVILLRMLSDAHFDHNLIGRDGRIVQILNVMLLRVEDHRILGDQQLSLSDVVEGAHLFESSTCLVFQ